MCNGVIMKKGRFGRSEMTFIEQNCETLSPEEIADKLDRDPLSVTSWIKENVGFSASQKKEAAVAHELKNKPYYLDL